MSVRKAQEAYQKKLTQQRVERTPEIVALYAKGLGHKAIEKETGIPRSSVRRILIEQRVYQPGKLQQSQHHRQKAAEGRAITQKRCDAVNEFKRALKNIQASVRETTWKWQRARRKIQGTKRAKRKWGPEDRIKWSARYKADPQFRMGHILRKKVIKLVKRGDKAAPTLVLLGCTAEAFIAHIEGQWTKGMTWANHGVGRGKWNIDHIIPCASFDLTDHSQQRRCFHYTNMRPMWGRANIRKSDSVPRTHQWRML